MKRLLDLPAYALNGFTVACGIAIIQLVVHTLEGPHAAALALGGAVCASLADVPNTVARTWIRVCTAAVLSVVSSAVTLWLMPTPLWMGAAVALIAFGAMMAMAWGARAGAAAFAPILALIFTMAVPPGSTSLPELVLWNAVGAAVYLVWSLVSGALLQRRYRALALGEVLAAAAGLLRSRAGLLASPAAGADDTRSMQAWIQGEVGLADRLQSARDLVFAQPDGANAQREIGIVLLTIELRDVLLASRLDLDALAQDDGGRWILGRMSSALLGIAKGLDAAAQAVRRGDVPDALPALDLQALFAGSPLATDDDRRRLLPALENRLRRLDAEVRRIRALQRGEGAASPLSRSELQKFVAPEGWPLAALRTHWSGSSPVLRHAVRAGLALCSAYYIAQVLPWASHPQWLVLSVAVVLRGSLEQTLARRNARIGGTVLGCGVVLALSPVHSSAALSLVFVAAVGIAHAFVLQRYWLTACAASVMALLQTHMMLPAEGFAIPERVADTVLGAALAWAFSYVLPSWERRRLPDAITRALKELDDYASHSLRLQPGDQVAQRLSRRRAYDAFALLAGALQRSSAEPRAVRLPLKDVAALIDHGQHLMAHLSMVRMTLATRRAELDQAAIAALAQTQATLARCLTLEGTGPAPAVDLEALSRLPSAHPTEDFTPWLLRRLALLAHDAHRIHDTAAAALIATRPGARRGAAG
ncbi:MAG: FUSC family protein [Burkholderiaceae bacterium]|nr:FUSC family protein [Burkholderiaceae bacterium]